MKKNNINVTEKTDRQMHASAKFKGRAQKEFRHFKVRWIVYIYIPLRRGTFALSESTFIKFVKKFHFNGILP